MPAPEDAPRAESPRSDPSRLDAYRAAGLWDPDGEVPVAGSSRVELLDFLTERGATLERMSATEDADLIGLGFDLVVEAGTMSLAELAERVGADVDELVNLYRSLGVTIDDGA